MQITMQTSEDNLNAELSTTQERDFLNLDKSRIAWIYIAELSQQCDLGTHAHAHTLHMTFSHL